MEREKRVQVMEEHRAAILHAWCGSIHMQSNANGRVEFVASIDHIHRTRTETAHDSAHIHTNQQHHMRDAHHETSAVCSLVFPLCTYCTRHVDMQAASMQHNPSSSIRPPHPTACTSFPSSNIAISTARLPLSPCIMHHISHALPLACMHRMSVHVIGRARHDHFLIGDFCFSTMHADRYQTHGAHPVVRGGVVWHAQKRQDATE